MWAHLEHVIDFLHTCSPSAVEWASSWTRTYLLESAYCVLQFTLQSGDVLERKHWIPRGSRGFVWSHPDKKTHFEGLLIKAVVICVRTEGEFRPKAGGIIKGMAEQMSHMSDYCSPGGNALWEWMLTTQVLLIMLPGVLPNHFSVFNGHFWNSIKQAFSMFRKVNTETFTDENVYFDSPRWIDG